MADHSIGNDVRHIYERLRRLDASRLVTHHEVMTWHMRRELDGLVHSLVPVFRTEFWMARCRDGARRPMPIQAITSCAVAIARLDVQNLMAKGYEPDGWDIGMPAQSAALSCLRCLGGAKDGEAYRQNQKALAFSENYGMSGRRFADMMSMKKRTT
jgi:hypothetical protein